MNVISKVVTTCFECATKVRLLLNKPLSFIIFYLRYCLFFQCELLLPKRVRFPCSSLDGKHLPLQLSPQALKRLANLTSSITLPRYSIFQNVQLTIVTT